MFSRDSLWWIHVGDNPLPLTPRPSKDPIPQQLESLSSILSASQDMDMHDQPAPVLEGQLENQGTTTHVGISGVERRLSTLLPSGDSLEILAQDIVMNMATIGEGEQSSTLLGSTSMPTAL